MDGWIYWDAGAEWYAIDFASCFWYEAEEGEGEALREGYPFQALPNDFYFYIYF